VEKEFSELELEILKDHNVRICVMFYNMLSNKEKLYFVRRIIQPGRNISLRMEDSIARKQSNILAEIRRSKQKKGLDAKSFDKNITFYPMSQCWQYLKSDWECVICFAGKKDIYENNPNTMIAITINCNHGFCGECVAQWLNKETKFPYCRLDFK
jgi:hypothetical protein